MTTCGLIEPEEYAFIEALSNNTPVVLSVPVFDGALPNAVGSCQMALGVTGQEQLGIDSLLHTQPAVASAPTILPSDSTLESLLDPASIQECNSPRTSVSLPSINKAC